MAEKTALEPLRVMSRADYAVQVKEQMQEQPPTWLVLRGETVIAEVETEAEAAEYVVEND